MEKNSYVEQMHDFRRFVNENNDFLILLSSQPEEKNLWNCICSAMDWLDVATEYIDSVDINSIQSHEIGLQLYTYISAVDIISESVKKLHKYFIDSNTTPFNEDKHIFNGQQGFKDDNEYFKRIRAVFGAHPVDIVEGGRHKKGAKEQYASWPNKNIYPEFDFSVLLYSQSLNEPDIPFGFKIEQLQEFLISRWAYLDKIRNSVVDRRRKFENGKRGNVIKRVSNPLKQLDILAGENQHRLRNEYYAYLIDELKSFFNTTFTCTKNKELIDKFREKLVEGIDEIYEGIQELKIEETTFEQYLNPKYSYNNGFGYAFSKLSEHAKGYNTKYLIGIETVIKEVEQFVVCEYENIDELYWLTIIGLNLKSGLLK